MQEIETIVQTGEENHPQKTTKVRKQLFTFKVATSALIEGKLYILAAIIICSVGVIYGTNAPIDNYYEHFGNIFDKWEKILSRNNPTLVIFSIFINNFKVAAFSIWLSFIIGLYPVMSAFLNGRDIGIVAMSLLNNGHSFSYFLSGISPHGIFEIPAMFIAWGLGIWCAKGLEKKEYKQRVSRANRVLVFYILPLLVVAAIIEGMSIE